MPIGTTNAISGPYYGNGVATAFPFTFEVLSADQVKAQVDGVYVSTSTYSVSLTGTAPSIGTITFNSPPASGAEIYVFLDPSFRQDIEFADGAPYLAGAVNDGYDQAALRDQVLKRDIGRSLLVPLGEAGIQLPPVASRAGKYISFDAGGGATASAGTGNDPALRTDIAESTGAGLSGFSPSATYSSGTVGEALQKFAQTASGQFYTDYGGKVQRLRDRVFVGAASDNLGTNAGAQPDWLTTYLLANGRSFGFQQVAQAAVLTDTNDTAANAFVAAAQTSNFTATGNPIGLLGVGVNNNTAQTTGAWGGYFEGFQNSGTHGPAYGVEVDVVNFGSSVYTDPWGQSATQVVGLQIGSGAEFTANPATAAINIQKNGSTFNAGIVFGRDSLTGANGTTGTAPAILMGTGHSLVWYSASGVNTAAIYGLSTSAAHAAQLQFNDGSVTFNAVSNTIPVFAIGNNVSGNVNYLSVNPSATANPVQVIANGSDANIDIQLSPKGSGGVWLGAYTAGAPSATGYLTVKDSTGTVRKLLAA